MWLTGIISSLLCLTIITNTVSAEKRYSQPYPTKEDFHKHYKTGSCTQYDGTIFVSPDIIISNDPTTYAGTAYIGEEIREVFDRRTDRYEEINMHLFNVRYDDYDAMVEFLVNPEFHYDQAESYVEEYAPLIGQLGYALREDLRTVTIHDGNYGWGGGSGDLLIHVGRSVEYFALGIAEETLVHEACHVSLDHLYETDNDAWSAAVEADGKYISEYAEEQPGREDIAETFLLYQAVRYRPCSLTKSDFDYITNRIPNRIQYFDNLNLNMDPVVLSDECSTFSSVVNIWICRKSC